MAIANPWWAPFVLSRLIDPLMRDPRTQAPELAGMKARDRALDVCCGTGALVLHYARLNLFAAGIDMDPRVIEVAEKKRRREGLTNAWFQTASALALPFRDDSFDHASISMSLHENERGDRDAIISEMKRVVRSEGSLVFIDYKVPLPRTLFSRISRVVEFVAGRDHNRCFKDFVDQGGLGELLRRNQLHGEEGGDLGPMVIMRTPGVSVDPSAGMAGDLAR